MLPPSLDSSRDASRNLDPTAVAPAFLSLLVHMRSFDAFLVVGFPPVADSRRGRDDASEKEMLHHDPLTQYLCDEHASHAGLDLGPAAFRVADIIQHRTVPSKAVHVLDGVDEGYLAKVHVLVGELFEDKGVVDGQGTDERVGEQLGGAE